jgi:hypothetical protein
MKGDFSRIRFNPAKNYVAVLKQQGRVDLDADANEQCAIDNYLRDTTNVDVIGQFGGPIGDAGFEIKIEGAQILIGPGRYYVDGILVENRQWLHYDEQPWLNGHAYTALELLEAPYEGSGKVTVHLQLEVWQRLVTGLDDHCLQEPALGQADTTARLQTVWRVVGSLQNAGSSNISAQDKNASAASAMTISKGSVTGQAIDNPIAQLSSCCQSLYQSNIIPRTGAMGADTGQAGNDCGCQPIAAAGYQGLENQLYRVEIHSGGDQDSATFKWSRENGSVVSQVTSVSGPVVTVSSLGPDANLGFQAGQWVELSDDTYLFGEPANLSGSLYQILSINQATLQVTVTTSVTGVDPTRNARMRRWDQRSASATVQGVPLSLTPVQLENGIEVSFRNGQYYAGDYWTIPARAANGQIDWPPCGGNGNFFQPAKYIEIHTAPLACIHGRASDNYVNKLTSHQYDNRLFVVNDCRLLFPPLTALNADTVRAALHVSAVSWVNDDVMTVDTLLQQGLSVTFDQAPVCPWGGGNFRVTMETPVTNDPFEAWEGKVPGFPAPGKYPPGTDVFLRAEQVLDSPLGITVSGEKVSWITPAITTGVVMYESYYLYIALNFLLKSNSPIGFARMRVKLDGAAVFANAPNGNIYLDGVSFGDTGSRAVDGSPSVNLGLPSGNSLKVRDFESWFYLAPSVLIASATIQLLDAGTVVGTNAVTVLVDYNGAMTGLEVNNPNAPAAVPVTAVQAVIRMTYPPVTPCALTLTLNGTGVGTVVTIQANATVPAGQISLNVPINILASPGIDPAGGGITDNVTLTVSVAGLFSTIPFATQPALAITGGPVPTNLQ